MAKEKLIYENEEKEDIKFPVLLNYENLAYTPEQLKDINVIEGTKLNTAINDAGQVITDLINSKLNTQTKQILDGFTFGASGAIKIIIDNNNGIWISPSGILGKKAGATTFALDTYGNATFAGTLSAASGTLGTITSAYITAGTFQTAASGQRVVVDGVNNFIRFYDSNGYDHGTIYGNASYSGIYVSGDLSIVGNINAGSGNITGYRLYLNAISGSGIEPTYNNSITCGSASYRWSNVYSTNGNFSDTIVANNISVGNNVSASTVYATTGMISGYFTPYTHNTYDLGNTTYMWRNLFIAGYIYTVGTVIGDWKPYYTSTYNLGTSTNKWYATYSLYYYSCDLPTHNSATEVFRKIPDPVIQKGEFGVRKYFKVESFPDEMTAINDKGEKDIEITSTLGVTVQAVREIIKRLDTLEQKVGLK